MAHHEEDKKEKIRKRNKRNWIIFTQVAEQLKQVSIAAPEIEAKAHKHRKDEQESASMKMPAVYNRLSNSRRIAEERWNRYAGTSDAGGRGR